MEKARLKLAKEETVLQKSPTGKIIGDLSNTEKVLVGLDMVARGRQEVS